MKLKAILVSLLLLIFTIGIANAAIWQVGGSDRNAWGDNVLFENASLNILNRVVIGNISEEWTPYSGNPLLGVDKTFGSVVENNGTYYLYYSNFRDNTIHRAYSSDGKTWKDYNESLLHSIPGRWDSSAIAVPLVFIENGTWHMFFRGKNKTDNIYRIGSATSSNGIRWTENPSNPIITNGTNGTWDDGDLDPCFSITKNDSGAYNLWYSTIGGSRTNSTYHTRSLGLATSTNLITWIKNPNNPMYTGGRFCADSFNYKNTYYMIVPAYVAGNYVNFELYSSPNITFYPSERTPIGIVKSDYGNGWDNGAEDTPNTFTTNLNRTLNDGEFRTYYAGSPDHANWYEGLLVMPNVNTALNTYRSMRTGYVTVWYDAGVGNKTYQLDINVTTPAKTNYTAWYRQNNTGDYVQLGGISRGNNSFAINTQYQKIDAKVKLEGDGITSPELISITFYSQANTSPIKKYQRVVISLEKENLFITAIAGAAVIGTAIAIWIMHRRRESN